MEKIVCVCILNRKKKIKFFSKPDQSDVDNLKEAIERVATKDRHLQLNLQGNTMGVSRYCPLLKCECEVEDDESIETGSILNIHLVKEERVSEYGPNEEQHSPLAIAGCSTIEILGSRNTKVFSSMTEEEIPSKYRKTDVVARKETEDTICSPFLEEKSGNQRGNDNKMANLRMESNSQTIGLQYDNSGSGDIIQKNCMIASGSAIIHVTESAIQKSSATADVLRDKMEQWYRKRAQLPHVPWLKKTECVNILRNYDMTLKENETKNEIPIREIFQDPCKRILIESPPGFGKTTLAMKIAYDWARKEEYLKQFDFVFVLLLRELRDCNIKDTIHSFIKQLMNSSTDVDDIDEILKNKKILLILDGYDELTNSEIKHSVNDILYRDEDETEQFIVLTTCRTGVFKTDTSKFGFARRKLFCDKKIYIDGLSDDQMKKLLEHILDKEHVNRAFAQIINIERQLPEISKCPLYVMMIAFLHTKQETLEIGMGRTEFYKKMINTLLNSRNQDVLTEPTTNLKNIFENQSTDDEIKKHDLETFGKLCWQLITESEFAFSDSQLTKTMYKVGFLTKSENILGVESVYYYKPIHRSFAEFFAAYYLFQEMQTAKDKVLSNECIQILSEQFVSSKGTTLIHSFLLGFLGEESYVLFKQLTPYAYVYSQIEAGFWNMLVDCSPEEEVIESLVPFIPNSLERPYNLSISNEFFENVIRKGTQTNRIERVRCRLNVCQICELPSDVCLKKISLVIFPNHLQSIADGKERLSANPDIQCNKLVIEFHGKYDNNDLNRTSITDWLKLILRVKFDSLSLRVFDNSTCLLLNECIMNNELLDQIEIYSFYCEVTDEDSSWIILLSLLIESNKLIRLSLIFENPVCLTALKPITIQAKKSEKLSGLQLWNNYRSPIEIDLDDLLINSKHRWNQIFIDECQINLKNSFPENTDITFLSLLPSNDCNPNIGNSVIKSFYCPYSLLQKIQERKEFYSTPFINTLQEITVQFEDSNMTYRNLSNINKFGAIKKFAIDLQTSLSTIPEELIDVLKLNEIEHLEIWLNEENEYSIANFISAFANILSLKQKGDNNFIERIVIFIRDNNLSQWKKMLMPLLKCLEEKYLKTVAIICFGLENEPIYFQSIDLDKFGLHYRLAGSKEVDMEFWKNQYLDDYMYPQIDITLR